MARPDRTTDPAVTDTAAAARIRLSRSVETVAAPLVYAGGRCFRVKPEVSDCLDELATLQARHPGSDGWIHRSAISADPAIVACLLERGFVESEGMPQPRERDRDPLSIHVRGYSPTMLRLFEALAYATPVRYARVGIAFTVIGLVTLAGYSTVFSPARFAAALADVSWFAVLCFLATATAVLVWHEAGHVGACRRSGRRPARAGAGVYLTRVVFFVDLACLDGASRRDKLEADSGGLANDSIVLVTGILLTVTGVLDHAVGDVVFVSAVASFLFALNPWIKSDGYWFLRDAVGAGVDPARWLTGASGYLRAVRGRGVPVGQVRYLRLHCLLGVLWLGLCTGWLVWLWQGFFASARDHPTAWAGWLTTTVFLVVSVVGFSAVIRAMVRRKFRE